MKLSELLELNSGVNRLDLELLTLEALGLKDRSDLVLFSERIIKEVEFLRFSEMLDRRKRGEPLAYILGRKEFYGRKFKVDKRVLIPRPETEELVTEGLKLQPDLVVDIGTGSGCIAISLDLEFRARGQALKIVGVDQSRAALLVAEENQKRLGSKVDFLQADLLGGDLKQRLQQSDKIIVVANLPYVNRDWDWLGLELDYEPKEALYAGKEGLELIFKLIDQVVQFNIDEGRKIKYLILESDEIQHEEIIQYAKEKGLELVASRGLMLNFLG